MKSALLVFLGTLFVSCSPRIDFSTREAPRTESELGWIVENLEIAEAQKLSQSSTLKISAIDQKRKIFEIQGLKQKDILDLKQAMPHLKFQKNGFVHFNSPTNTDEPDCTLGFEDIESIKAPDIITLGQSLTIEQKTNPLQPVSLYPPMGSKLKKDLGTAAKIEVTPDMVGWFKWITIHQDERGFCQRSIASTLVTSNPKFVITPKEKRSLTERLIQIGMDADLPWYLKELEAEKLWTVATGKKSVVAILDSGINYQHRLLKNKIHINENEIPDNHIDDDKNGYIDDVIGYDFIFDDAYPFDEEGHGSHVSGLVVADGVGLAPDAEILPLKAISDLRSDYASLAKAIYYAIDAKVQVLNISAGQPQEELPEVVNNALKEAEKNGILMVVAAGNGLSTSSNLGVDIDQIKFYPQSLGLKNMLVVTASDRKNLIASYANYGVKTVSLVAPGGMNYFDPILSCYIENPSHIELFNDYGTSMAAPLVSASAAVLLSKQSNLSAEAVISRFLKSGEESADLQRYIISGKKFRPLLSFE